MCWSAYQPSKCFVPEETYENANMHDNSDRHTTDASTNSKIDLDRLPSDTESDGSLRAGKGTLLLLDDDDDDVSHWGCAEEDSSCGTRRDRRLRVFSGTGEDVLVEGEDDAESKDSFSSAALGAN